MGTVRVLSLFILVGTGTAGAQEMFEGRQAGGPYEYEVDARTYKTPTKKLKAASFPAFADDLDFRGLKLALRRQIKRFESKNLTGKIVMGGVTYPLTKVRDSVVVFDQVLDQFFSCSAARPKDVCYREFNQAIRARFNVFTPALTKKDPRFGRENFALFTGYNTYAVEGRLTRDAEFKHPIYINPRANGLNGKTRVDIHFDSAFDGKGLELFYVKSLFDIYMMHVQGSGKVLYSRPDGTRAAQFLEFDGTNKQRWEFISLYMAKKGYITNGSIPSQRKFMHNHPEKEREIYTQCPSYVYFKPTDDEPVGSDSVPMTDGRTLAQDNANYGFKGLLSFVDSRRPAETGNYDMEEENKSDVPFVPFARFFIDQDTGGAINGKARGDIYFGSSEYAMFASMYQAEVGKIHYLLLK